VDEAPVHRVGGMIQIEDRAKHVWAYEVQDQPPPIGLHTMSREAYGPGRRDRIRISRQSTGNQVFHGGCGIATLRQVVLTGPPHLLSPLARGADADNLITTGVRPLQAPSDAHRPGVTPVMCNLGSTCRCDFRRTRGRPRWS
jgi:hypothetical protein